MTAPNYSLGGGWAAIPNAAIYGTHPGTYHVEYPPAADYTYAGQPCSAVGLPSIVIRTAWLTDTGMAFWQGIFANSAAESAALSIEAFDPRASSVTRWAGTLLRPTWESVGPGATAGTTIYRGVEIRIVNCGATT